MTPQFPFKDKYVITQGYYDNFNNYEGGKHGALDIVPLKDGVGFPSNIYPIFDGSTLYTLQNDPKKGNGIMEKVVCDADLITYLKSKNLVPQTHTGEVTLEILYWHILDVLDHDGTLTQDTPIARCGNTGLVYSGGQPVPDDQKGKPPYPGLHLHLVTVLKSKAKIFNLDKDSRGRIDPQIILSYKGTMFKVKKVRVNGAFGVLVDTPNATFITKAEDELEWRSYSKPDSYQIHSVNDNGSTDWTVDLEINF